MLEQIDLFEIATEPVNGIPLEDDTASNKLFPKWRMFEYIERLNGKTALVSYLEEEDPYEFRVPIKFGEIKFGSNYGLSNKLNLREIGPDFRMYDYKGTLEKLEKQDNLHQFYYQDKENMERLSKATFELKHYSISRVPKKQFYDAEKPLNQLIGFTARVELRCSSDGVMECVRSLPFKILSLKEADEEITLIGTNDVYIHAKGFKKVRESSDLIFDIYSKQNGYCNTFHLEI